MIGYVRYSPRVKVARRKTDKGTEGDSPVNSVENQKDQVQRWLKSHALEPLGEGDWIVDELVSARTTPLCERTGGAELLARIKRGEREVIASKIDRLFRSVTDGLLQLEAWRKQKVSLYLADGVVCDLSTTSGWACTTILLMTSEFYPRHVAECTSLAMASMQRDGQRISRHAPYGYRICPDNPELIEPVEKEQAVCAEVIRLHKSGLGHRQIARQMDESGVKSRSGKKWHHHAISRIIDRDDG
jgi:DNA invertase Pin-like site-specific DNA recombinase